MPAPNSPSLLSKISKLLFSYYVLVALAYTSYDFILKPSFELLTTQSPTTQAPAAAVDIDSSNQEFSWIEKAKGLANFDSSHLKWDWTALRHKFPVPSFAETPDQDLAPEEPVIIHPYPSFYRASLPQLHWDDQTFSWNMSLLSASGIKPDDHAVQISEDFFTSKIFGESFGPSKVIPYYFRASEKFDEDDITITTLVTLDRFKVLNDLVERYQGPVSVTIRFPPTSSLSTSLSQLHELYLSSPTFPRFVDVHLVIDPFERQFNMWRNVARFFSRTEFVMMLDVDFWICTDFRERVKEMLRGGSNELENEVGTKLKNGEIALVVPAFEFSKQEDGLDWRTFPTEKKSLKSLWKSKQISMFHASWQPGHAPTNYSRYFSAKPGEIYPASDSNYSYEPYAIFRRDAPWCDERFVGYGGNKAACLWEIHLSGVDFWVLPDDWLIHQSHSYQEKARKSERNWNREVYTNYRMELCFRYLQQFTESDMIDSPRAKNMLQKCGDIKGFKSTATKYIEAVKTERTMRLMD